MNIRIQFRHKTKEQLEHIFNAEQELSKAGVSFDTGYEFKNERRDWEFDFSLKGAEVIIKK